MNRICPLVFLLSVWHAAAAPPEFVTVRSSIFEERIRRTPGGAAAAEEEAPPVEVGRYEKFELRIDLKATYANPYDPEEVDLWAEFQAPSGRIWKIWGFYNPSSWSALWMVRFAPVETGTWRYTVKVRDREGVAESKPGEFIAVESAHHGFVGIAPNGRYLRYSDGTSFYGAGLWYNDSYEQFGRGQITEAGLDRLKELGANFIGFFPTPLETMGTGLGRYDENRAGRMDQLFEWCEKRDIHISWNLWFHSYISMAVWGGGNARYRHNPYHRIAEAKDFFASPEAYRHVEKLHRYILARWGYSRALFLWFVIDEINGTEGWRDGDQKAAEEWCRKIDEYLNRNDPYGRPTTGTQSGGIEQWWPGGYQIFDIAAREIYEAQGHPMPKEAKPNVVSEDPLKFSYINYATQIQNLWNGFDKPAIIGECGWDHTYYEPGMPGYLAMYHNALWVSLANGAAATPFWWAFSPMINDSVVTRQMRHLADFAAGIDFAGIDPRPGEIAVSEGDAWVMAGKGLWFGWVVNPLRGVAGETFTVSGVPDGAYEVHLYRTWRGQYLEPQAVEASGGKLAVKVPELVTTGGHALHMGNDVAFRILPGKAGAASPAAPVPAGAPSP